MRATGYPVIPTELSRDKGTQYIQPYYDYNEQNGISWIYLDLTDTGGNGYYPATHPAEWPRTWPADPFYQ